MLRQPRRTTRTAPLYPYTTRVRAVRGERLARQRSGPCRIFGLVSRKGDGCREGARILRADQRDAVRRRALPDARRYGAVRDAGLIPPPPIEGEETVGAALAL